MSSPWIVPRPIVLDKYEANLSALARCYVVAAHKWWHAYAIILEANFYAMCDVLDGTLWDGGDDE
jgi:hypothetical protein